MWSVTRRTAVSGAAQALSALKLIPPQRAVSTTQLKGTWEGCVHFTAVLNYARASPTRECALFARFTVNRLKRPVSRVPL